MTDILLRSLGALPFSWGRHETPENSRDRYIAALRAADAGDFAKLAVFVRG